MKTLYLKVTINNDSTAYKIKKLITDEEGNSVIFSQKSTSHNKVFIWAGKKELSASETEEIILKSEVIDNPNEHRTISLTVDEEFLPAGIDKCRSKNSV